MFVFILSSLIHIPKSCNYNIHLCWNITIGSPCSTWMTTCALFLLRLSNAASFFLFRLLLPSSSIILNSNIVVLPFREWKSEKETQDTATPSTWIKEKTYLRAKLLVDNIDVRHTKSAPNRATHSSRFVCKICPAKKIKRPILSVYYALAYLIEEPLFCFYILSDYLVLFVKFRNIFFCKFYLFR